MDHAAARSGSPMQGIALVAVMWMIAALSLIATSLIAATRPELRAVAQQRDALVAAATGDAAIALALQDLVRKDALPALFQERTEWVDGQPVRVSVTPITGLVDVAHAPESLLAALFSVAGGIGGQEASMLAARIVAARSAADPQAREALLVVEDLLRPGGIDYPLYAKISPLITAGEGSGDGKVNPLAAPVRVLQVLAGGNGALAAGFIAARESRGRLADTTVFPGALTGNAVSPLLRIEAFVPAGDVVLRRSRSVDIRQASPSGAPWSVYRSESTPMPPDVTDDSH